MNHKLVKSVVAIFILLCTVQIIFSQGDVQKIAIPSYFYFCDDTKNDECKYWKQLNSSTKTVGIALINPDDGPGKNINQDYVKQTKSIQNKKIKVLGYIDTVYGKRDIKTQLIPEIDKYYLWYGVDGIFFDDIISNCKNNSYVFYKKLYLYVRSKHPTKNMVILNPGTNTEECYMKISDVIVTFEGSYDEYLKWTANKWESGYCENRFWHLIYKTCIKDLENAVNLSKKRNAGWVYVTSDNLCCNNLCDDGICKTSCDDNPWDTLPSASYWNKEQLLVNEGYINNCEK